MAWDVLNRILEFARVRKLLNEDLLLGMKPFKDSGPAKDEDYELADEPEDADVMPYDSDQIEAIIAAAEGWERALVTLYFFTGIRRGEALASLGTESTSIVTELWSTAASAPDTGSQRRGRRAETPDPIRSKGSR
jgi:hypothetical protein